MTTIIAIIFCSAIFYMIGYVCGAHPTQRMARRYRRQIVLLKDKVNELAEELLAKTLAMNSLLRTIETMQESTELSSGSYGDDGSYGDLSNTFAATIDGEYTVLGDDEYNVTVNRIDGTKEEFTTTMKYTDGEKLDGGR